MAYTITINSDSPQARAFLNYAKNLDFVKVTKEKIASAGPILNSQQEKFKKRFTKSLKNLNDARAGRVEVQSLDDFIKSMK